METIVGLNTGTTKVIVDKFVCTNLVTCVWTHLMSKRTLNALIVSRISRWIIFNFSKVIFDSTCEAWLFNGTRNTKNIQKKRHRIQSDYILN